jgi:hypothetical protein
MSTMFPILYSMTCARMSIYPRMEILLWTFRRCDARLDVSLPSTLRCSLGCFAPFDAAPFNAADCPDARVFLR